MKTRQLIGVAIALSALVTAGSAFADRPYPPDEPAAMSTKSRAEVRAELDQARQEGLLNMNEDESYNVWNRSNAGMGAQGVAGSRYSGLTREEVKAELKQYMKDHPFGLDDEMHSR